MRKISSAINRLLSSFTGWLMLAMMLLLVADILWRLVGKPLQGMAEMSVFVMMIVIYLGLPRCEEYHEHVGLEFFTNALSKGARRITLTFAQMLAVLTVALLLYAVATNALAAYRTREAIEGIREMLTWPTKAVMVVGMVFFFIQAFLNLFRQPEPEPEPEQGEDAHADPSE